ncbi:MULTISPECIES: HTH domain-containing protein [Vagococcus]|uniref:RNA polymerase sigma-70 ECF-like HTH domain-containing protein n=1 Tax=Vagococcus fluvialis bH819 TaxID=1255619 RepID=A0A1X6WMB7_9ENTE|nr:MULTISPECIES: HTH domain-containing protein [Vagococcus]SLM85474.1 hypothetical protein FM121_05200 [Vagococcus fluvialis bH819]HCM89231.1 HTH domain-containing protein [Vagococcus sp.]
MSIKKELFEAKNSIFTNIQTIESEAIFPKYYRNAVLPLLKEIYRSDWDNLRPNPDGSLYREDTFDLFNDELLNITKYKTTKVYYKDSFDYYLKAEIDHTLLTAEEYGFLLFINILLDNSLHKYLPFSVIKDAYTISSSDYDLEWHLYEGFDRDSIKLATRFFQYHLQNSSLTPNLTNKIYDFSKSATYISDVNNVKSVRRIQKYLVYLDYLLFDLIKIENDIRLKVKDGNYMVGQKYYTITTLIQATRLDLQRKGYSSYLELNDYSWKKIPLLKDTIARNSYEGVGYFHFMNEELGLDEKFNLNKLEEPLIYYEKISGGKDGLDIILDEEPLPVPKLDDLNSFDSIDELIKELMIKRGSATKEEIEKLSKIKNINEISLKGIQEALIIRQHLKERPFSVLAKELDTAHIYKELELNKSNLTKNKMVSFFTYYCQEKNKKQDLLEMINSCRTIDFRTDKRLETLYRVKRYSKVESMYHKGLTLEEIAKTLNCSVRTVKYDIEKIKESYM